MNPRLTILLTIIVLCGCRTLSAPFREVPGKLDVDEVPNAIVQARTALQAGDTERAIDWMATARKTRGLATDVRNEVQVVIEEAVALRIEELSGPEGDPKELIALVELDLPRQLAVDAAIRGARMYFDRGDRKRAFNTIEDIDTKYPTHHERASAGELLADIGFSLYERPEKFWGIWEKPYRAAKPLEYLVLNYPSEPRCDLAYLTLGDIYEQRGLFALALERHENLLLYHTESSLAVDSEAAIPRLRLKTVKSPEYSRSQLLKARSELERWLTEHSRGSLEDRVRLDLGDCLRRLAESDIQIAHFYHRVDNPDGLRLHAQRAVIEARSAGDARREERALMILTRAGMSMETERAEESEL